MPPKALYAHLLDSRTFETQAEAQKWAQSKKTEYAAGGITIKTDINPVDASRRRWKAEVFQKI